MVPALTALHSARVNIMMGISCVGVLDVHSGFLMEMIGPYALGPEPADGEYPFHVLVVMAYPCHESGSETVNPY